RPSAPRHAALSAPPLLIAKGNVARYEERAIGCDDWAERILMVMTRQRPGIYRFIYIRFAVVVCVDQLGQLAALGAIQGTVFISETENLVQAKGELPEIRVATRRVFDDVDITTACADAEVAVRQHGQSSHFQDHTFGGTYLPYPEVVFLLGAFLRKKA